MRDFKSAARREPHASRSRSVSDRLPQWWRRSLAAGNLEDKLLDLICSRQEGFPQQGFGFCFGGHMTAVIASTSPPYRLGEDGGEIQGFSLSWWRGRRIEFPFLPLPLQRTRLLPCPPAQSRSILVLHPLLAVDVLKPLAGERFSELRRVEFQASRILSPSLLIAKHSGTCCCPAAAPSPRSRPSCVCPATEHFLCGGGE